MGLVLHAIIDEASKGHIFDEESFEEIWKIEVSRIEEKMLTSMPDKHLVPLSDSAKYYEVKKLQVWNLIRTDFLFKKGAGKPISTVKTEVWFQSKSNKIAGRIDLIKSNGEVTHIIDYKTGKVLDETGNPKEEYVLQLKLYAALYHENVGKWPDKLMLMGVDRSKHELSFDSEECNKLMESLSSTLREVNEKIAGNFPIFDLASPSPKSCRYCGYRPSCTPYWNNRDDSGQWPNDLRGEIVEKVQSKIGLIRLVIKNGDKKYIVRGLTNRHHIGDQQSGLAIFNLSKDMTSGQFIENAMTTCYGNGVIKPLCSNE